MESTKQKSILIIGKQEGFLELARFSLKQLKTYRSLVAGSKSYAWSLCIKNIPTIYIIDLDIDEKMGGLGLARKIRALHPQAPIILVTDQYQQHIYEECLEIAPSSFLSKDLSPLALIQAVELAILQQTPSHKGQVSKVEAPIPSPIAVKSIFIKTGDVLKPLNCEEVSYFFAKGKMTYAKIGKSNLAINILMKILEEQLDPPFWRIHKTYLVNTTLIDVINTKDNIVEIGNERLPIGHTYRKAFLEHLKLLK